MNIFVRLVVRLLSRSVRKKAKSLGIRYSFLLMRAQDQQLSELASLIESGVIRPVVDKVFPFERTGDALAFVETGRTRQGRHHHETIAPVFTADRDAAISWYTEKLDFRIVDTVPLATI